MFKNKLKLTKKLAMLAISAAVPFSILAASSHASAMNYPMLSKLLARKGSVPTAGTARRPVVQQPRVVEIGHSEIFDLSDMQLIQKARNISVQKDKPKVSLAYVCECGRFEFAKFLVKNNLVDINENLNARYDKTPLYTTIETISKQDHYNLDNLDFIKFLIDHGAEISGSHCFGSPLVFAFREVTRSFWYEEYGNAAMVPPMRKQLTGIIDYLIAQGMDINEVAEYKGDYITFREWLATSKYRSPFYVTVLNAVIRYGGKLYI